jgi:hypothetical protein
MYPLGAIVRCDAVVPPGRSRSLLLLVCQEPERSQPDVHFFQGRSLGVSGRGLPATVGRASCWGRGLGAKGVGAMEGGVA